MWELPAVVAACATLLSLCEITYTFRTGTWIALAQGSAWLLVLVNILAATFVYYMYGLVSPASHNSLYTAAIIGFTFPVALRSRITHFRPVGSARSKDENSGGLSISFERYYTGWQDRCRVSIDRAIGASNAAITLQLVRTYTELELRKCIESIQHESQMKEVQDEDRALLKKVDGIKAADERHRMLAAYVAKFGKVNYEKILKTIRDDTTSPIAEARNPITIEVAEKVNT